MGIRHEPIRLTESDLNKLLEYSASYPTGTTIGKCWKAKLRTGEWVHREYAEHPTDDSKVRIITRDIIIVGKDGRRVSIQPALIIEKILPDAEAVDFVARLSSGKSIVVLTPSCGTDPAGTIGIKELHFGRHELEAMLLLLMDKGE